MKRIVIFLLLLLSLNACTKVYPPQSNVYVYDVGYNPVPDKRGTRETVTELSTQIVVCTLRERKIVRWDAANGFQSLYTAEIEEILMDARGTTAVGDEIRFSSYNGLIPAAEAADFLQGTDSYANLAEWQKLADVLRAAPEDSFIRSSGYDGIPLAVGNTYLVYLCDWGMEPYREELGTETVFAEEPDDFFTECGFSHNAELRRGKVYRGRDTALQEITAAELKKQTREDISNRTGIAHQIGVYPYLREYIWPSSEP